MKKSARFLSMLSLALLGAAFPLAAGTPIEFSVEETAGLRRFGYPVTATLECPEGAFRDLAAARLLNEAGKSLPAQFTARTSWPDGSARRLEIDFTSSIGPRETERYRVEPSGGTAGSTPRGLSVTESADEILVASPAISHRIRKDGKPLLASISNKQEFLSPGGITTTLAPGPVEWFKRGPFNVTLRLGPVTLEYVNSKSWVKITQQAPAPRDLAVDASFLLPEAPVLWDLGVESWLYGYFRGADNRADLCQSLPGWKLLTDDGREYASGKRCEGWGHLGDQHRVIAFGVADFSAEGEPRIQFDGAGRFRASAKRTELTVYFHVVGQPVQVTALTSPPSMLAPLRVRPGLPTTSASPR